MGEIDIIYPTLHFKDVIIRIPDKVAMRAIMANIIGMNNGVIIDNVKFSTIRNRVLENGKEVVNIQLLIEEKESDDSWIILYDNQNESLETLEILIYKIMQSIERFPYRDIRHDVIIL